jgi:ElaB/YqjD/DUF883 family membrane-anchored ribosome-binding protein
MVSMEAATTTPNTSSTDGVKEQASHAADQAKDTLKDAAGQAKEQASHAGEQAKGQVRDQLDSRINQVADRAGSTAGDLRSVGDELRNRGQDQPARLADQLADRVEQAADYLKNNGADRVLNDLEAFGRRRPWVVIAGGLAVGFVGSRLLKSSSVDRYRGSSSTPAASRPAPNPVSSASPTPTPAPTPPPAPSAQTPTTSTTSIPAVGAAPHTVGEPNRVPSSLENLEADVTSKNRDRENGLSSDGNL